MTLGDIFKIQNCLDSLSLIGEKRRGNMGESLRGGVRLVPKEFRSLDGSSEVKLLSREL